MNVARRLRGLAIACSSFALAFGCGDDDSGGDDADPIGGGAGAAGQHGGDSGAGGGGDDQAPDALDTLASMEAYAALAGEGAEVKYLAAVAGTEAPPLFAASPCVFQNTHRYPYHVQYLRTLPEYATLSPARYEDLVLRRASRELWGGQLKLFSATDHPVTGEAGVIAYSIYAGTQGNEALTVDDIVDVDQKLKRCAEFARTRLVFTPEGPAQLQQVEPLIAALEERDVTVVPPSRLRPGLSAEVYNPGESYGYLTLIPAGAPLDDVGPRDVVICDAAPQDLSLVAGLVTVQPQSVASHLNLRLREKGVPSASVPSIFENALVTGLANRLVHVTVSTAGLEIEPAAIEDAQAFWESRRPSIGQPSSDLDVDELRPFPMLSAADVKAFGTKAANLGELHGVLAARNRVEGFAIPFRHYAEFMRDNALDAEVDALLEDARVPVDSAYKREKLAALRRAVRGAPLPASLRADLERAALDVYGETALTTRLRFRSSTNAEDLPGLSGAGLYDSSSGCLADDLDSDARGPSACLTPEQEAYLRAELDRRTLELAEHPDRTHLVEIIADLRDDLEEEKSADAALRRVWSSLWSERAFDDREYYGIDHRRVFMGVAVHPAFVGERLESVVFTNLEAEGPAPLYRVVSQVGETGVAEPTDPTAAPEILTFRRSADDTADEVTLVSASSLSPDGAPLWSDEALGELSAALFAVQDHFAASVYPDLAPLVLDIEVDVTHDGLIVVKQARPAPTE